VAAVAALLAACSDSPVAPRAVPPTPDFARAALDGEEAPPTFLTCGVAAPARASAVIGRTGGVLRVDGHALLVPPRAVPRPTRFTITVPASPFLEIDISAEGRDDYRFARPVAVTISYARCDPASLPDARLEAWWVEGNDGVIAGVDDRRSRRVTFLTDHLSGYAVIYRTRE
jgi:hypothetical protein